MENSQKIWHHWVMALGGTSMITQLVLLREFLSIFYGNELIMGITLSLWLIINASGALSFKIIPVAVVKFKLGFFLQILLSLLPIATLILLRYARSYWFYSGVSLNIAEITILSTITILPYCLLSGYLFPAISHSLSQFSSKNPLQISYYLDTFGAVMAGALFSFVLIHYLSHIQILCLAGLVITIISFEYNKFHDAKPHYYIITLIITACLLIIIQINPDITTKQNLFKNQEILFSEESPYGNITVTKTNEQINFYENGNYLFSSNNIIENEEVVHYTMAQHPQPKKILLAGGGASGVLHEILKYQIEQIDYVEINPKLIEAGQFFTTNIPNNNKINIIEKDARLFIKQTHNKYDIAIIHLSTPINLSTNRYYTIEFFALLKGKMNKNAIASIALQGNTNYISTSNQYLFATLYHSIRKNFRNINIFAGNNNYFVMSDNTLSFHIADSIANKNITNLYVNQYYTDAGLLQNRHNNITNLISKTVTLNSDMHPISTYWQLIQWLNKNNINEISILIFTIILLVIILSIIFLSNTYNSSIFTSGFTSISLEIIYLLIFQTIYGYIYDILSIIITLFMLGIGLGVYFCNFMFKTINLKTIQRLHLYLIIYAVITPAILFLLNQYQLGKFWNYLIILGFAGDIAIITGMLFTANSLLYNAPIKKTAANLYGFDLIGAALGAFLITSLLLPLLGYLKVCLFIGFLNLMIIVKILINKKKSIL